MLPHWAVTEWGLMDTDLVVYFSIPNLVWTASNKEESKTKTQF